MKPGRIFGVFGIVVSLAALAQATPAAQQNAFGQALGKWYSVERFENEPRITLSFRQTETSIVGWAVMLGQRRKADDRATLGLSFTGAIWNGQALRFSTILPEDEGTLGWELRVTSATKAVLVAVTENGTPIQEELKWDMTR